MLTSFRIQFFLPFILFFSKGCNCLGYLHPPDVGKILRMNGRETYLFHASESHLSSYYFSRIKYRSCANRIHRTFLGGVSSVGDNNNQEIKDEIQRDDILQRLHLEDRFSRWRFLQRLLEDEIADVNDVNQILSTVLKSFVLHPRPLELADGNTNPSPRLTQHQCKTVNDLLTKNEEDQIPTLFPFFHALSESDGGRITWTDEDVAKQLETLLPNPAEDEDAFKSGWDLVMELYGKEATKMSQQGRGEEHDNGKGWNARSVVTRLLLHYDFLTHGIGKL